MKNKNITTLLITSISIATIGTTTTYAAETSSHSSTITEISNDSENNVDARCLLPNVNFNNIYVGDSSISGTSSYYSTVTIMVNNTKYVVETNRGTFSVNLREQIKKRDLVKGKQKICLLSSNWKTANILGEEEVTPASPRVNEVTDKDTSITGTSDPNMIIISKILDKTYQTMSDSNGNFVNDMNTSYPEGTEITSYSKSKTGKMSEKVITYVAGTETLEMTLEDFTSQDLLLKGTVSKANTEFQITIGTDVYKATSDSSGNFTLYTNRFYKAGTEIVYYATDELVSSETYKAKVLPRIPTIDNLTVGSEKVSGVVDSKSLVYVKINGEESYTAVANTAGKYSVDISKVKLGDSLEVYQVFDGVESQHAYLTVLTLKY